MCRCKRTIPWWLVTGSSKARRRRNVGKRRGGVTVPLSCVVVLACVVALSCVTAAAAAGQTEGAAPAGGPPAVVVSAVDGSAVVVESSGPCGQDRVCHRLQVTCGGLAPRGAEVTEYEVAASRGTVILATGVYGNRPYDEYAERQTTLQELSAAGFEVFALRWSDGKKGWGSTAEGAGYEAPMCGYNAVVRWLAAERADRPQVVCAQGNSGAALQIAYGLAVYGLGDILDLAVLTGGPPLTRIDQYCFAPTRRNKQQLWKANGRRITDYLMGWEGAGDHCKNASGDAAAVVALQATGLLPVHLGGNEGDDIGDGGGGGQQHPERRRRFDYPYTHLVFLLSEGDKSLAQARLYYDAVTSPKTWHSLPGRAHGVDREPATASEVRRQLIAACGAVDGVGEPGSNTPAPPPDLPSGH